MPNEPVDMITKERAIEHTTDIIQMLEELMRRSEHKDYERPIERAISWLRDITHPVDDMTKKLWAENCAVEDAEILMDSKMRDYLDYIEAVTSDNDKREEYEQWKLMNEEE